MNNDHQNKEKSEKDTSTETKKDGTPPIRTKLKRKTWNPPVKPKVTMEYPNPENLDEFIQELKEIYPKIEMRKKDAEEELVETKRNFNRFMEKHRIQTELILN